MPLESPNEPPMSTPPYGPGIEITGRITAGIRADPDAGGGGVRRQAAARVRRSPRRSCSRAARSARPSSTPASCPISCPRRARSATATGPARRCPADIVDRRVEITGPVDRKMIDQRAQLGRQRVHGGLRGREHAEVGQQPAGPHQSARRDPPPDRLHVARGQDVPAEREDRRRCSCARAAGICPRSTC